nr:glycosyltransferase family A protein [uncultured Agathobaculum sp.]
MENTNDIYQKALSKIDKLLDKKQYQASARMLNDLYRFKPVRLTWFVRKARLAWITDGIEAAREVLKNKFTLNYCYEGIPEALALLIEMQTEQGAALEAERISCASDLVQNLGSPQTIYHKLQGELEVTGKSFWESGSPAHATALWRNSYIVSDAISTIVIKQYLKKCCSIDTDDLLWASDCPNIQYVRERVEEENGSFIIMAEEENKWQSAALAKMLAALGKCVYLLQPPCRFDGTDHAFFNESAQACINNLQKHQQVFIINTSSILQDGQEFVNRFLIIQELIKNGGKLFTVLSSGCLMDDVALEGEMRKHFERFNLQLGDIFETNFSAGWVGNYLHYIQNIYGFDVNASLNAPAIYKFSIVIPARNSAATLRCTLQTCLDQDFPTDAYEIVISDNSTDNNRSIYNLCKELSDPRIRYIKPHRPLQLAKSFEFAYLHTRGEFVLSLGSDDGLLPWALRTLDKVRQQFPNENIIQWERGFYAWPGFNGGQENQFIIPRRYKKQPIIRHVPCNNYLQALAHNAQNVYALPLLYINSGFRRTYMKVLLEKTGRIWDSPCQDIYTGIVNILINPTILSLTYPLSIAGMSAGSIGTIETSNKADPNIRSALEVSIKGMAISCSTLSLPEKLVAEGKTDIALIARYLYRCAARGLIRLDEITRVFDTKMLFQRMVSSCSPLHDQSEAYFRTLLYTASMHGEAFLSWFDQKVFSPAMIPTLYGEMRIPKYQEGPTSTGGEVLDASKYGVENIAQAVDLFVQRSGLS